MGPCFVDTNILIYAIECGEDSRSEPALRLVDTLLENGSFRTSTQVLQELYVTLTRKIRPRLTHQAAIRYVDSYDGWPVVAPGFDDIREAMQLSDSAQISYWDALIVVCARLAGCGTLYTEDLNHGQVIAGVKIVNPFHVIVH